MAILPAVETPDDLPKTGNLGDVCYVTCNHQVYMLAPFETPEGGSTIGWSEVKDALPGQMESITDRARQSFPDLTTPKLLGVVDRLVVLHEWHPDAVEGDWCFVRECDAWFRKNRSGGWNRMKPNPGDPSKPPPRPSKLELLMEES